MFNFRKQKNIQPAVKHGNTENSVVVMIQCIELVSCVQMQFAVVLLLSLVSDCEVLIYSTKRRLR